MYEFLIMVKALAHFGTVTKDIDLNSMDGL